MDQNSFQIDTLWLERQWAAQCFSNRQWLQAIAYYTRIIEQEPQNADAYSQRTLYSISLWEEQVATGQRLLELDATHLQNALQDALLCFFSKSNLELNHKSFKFSQENDKRMFLHSGERAN